MIYIIIGASHAGKTQFTINSFLKGKEFVEYKDILPITETDSAYLLGTYSSEDRYKGSDKVLRKDIPRIFEQVQRLCGKGKDIVLEGDKITSHGLMDSLLTLDEPLKMFLIRVDVDEMIKRNVADNSKSSDVHLRAVRTKAEKLYADYSHKMESEIVLTDGNTDFSELSIAKHETLERAEPTELTADRFAVFILSHGRAKNVTTWDLLRRDGYTGDIYVICDDLDDQVPEYRERYGDRVIVFDKLAEYDRTDTISPEKKLNAVVYARNKCHDIAKDLGLTHFLVLDDDYHSFEFRYEQDGKLKCREVRDMNRAINMFCEFLDISGADTVAFAQGGDYIGGLGNQMLEKKITRKAMNSFFCRTDRPFKYYGLTNEDTTAYVLNGSRGHLYFTVGGIMLTQERTQAQTGGLTTIYLEDGTYMKSFYTVVACPSCVKVSVMGDKHMRIHHSVNWNNAVPLILSERFRK